MTCTHPGPWKTGFKSIFEFGFDLATVFDHKVQKFENLGESEPEIENIIARLSGAQMGSNHEKIKVEILVTHSL